MSILVPENCFSGTHVKYLVLEIVRLLKNYLADEFGAFEQGKNVLAVVRLL